MRGAIRAAGLLVALALGAAGCASAVHPLVRPSPGPICRGAERTPTSQQPFLSAIQFVCERRLGRRV